MPKRAAKERDFAVNAFRVVEQAIGEHMDGRPLKDVTTSKDQEMAKRGRLGGLRGGPVRAKRLSAQKLREIGQKGATARWQKNSGNATDTD